MVNLEGQEGTSRLRYLDSIKVALSALVILHHAAQPYGPMDWWYIEGQPSAQWIDDFAVLNAPFKMSLFFLIATYFLPRAVDRRRDRPFIGPRLKKLGGPILVGFFLVIPVLMYLYYLNFRDYGSIGFGDYYWNVYLGEGDEPADRGRTAVRSAGLAARRERHVRGGCRWVRVECFHGDPVPPYPCRSVPPVVSGGDGHRITTGARRGAR